jgi:glutathione S-transferase
MHSGFGALRGTCTMNCGLRIRLRDLAALRRNLTALVEPRRPRPLLAPYLAGLTFTAVDAFYAPVAFHVTFVRQGQRLWQPVAGVAADQAWYVAALQETWREQAHEAGRDAGTVLQDLRATA